MKSVEKNLSTRQSHKKGTRMSRPESSKAVTPPSSPPPPPEIVVELAEEIEYQIVVHEEPDIVIARSKRALTALDETVLLLTNNLMQYIVESWEGQPCTRLVYKSEPKNASEEQRPDTVSEEDNIENKEKTVDSTRDKSRSPESKRKFTQEGTTKVKGKKKIKKGAVRDEQHEGSVISVKQTKRITNSVMSSKLSKGGNNTSSPPRKRGRKRSRDNRKSSNDQDSVSVQDSMKSGTQVTDDILWEEPQTTDYLQWKLFLPDENVNILFKQGNKYTGRVSHKILAGKGKFTWADGAVYEGDFEDGEITGYGYFVWPDLSWYEGNFYKGYRHGLGIFVSPYSSRVYIGHWYMGKSHGKGILYYSSNNIDYYDGDWVHGFRHGVGIRKYPSGSCYFGGWKNGVRNGLGTMIWKDNHLYRGKWSNGLMHEFGEYTWSAFLNRYFAFPMENMYRGTWKNGVRQGSGILEFAGGGHYNGQWSNGMKHGIGMVICGSGKIQYGDPLFFENRPVIFEHKEPTQKHEILVKKRGARKGIIKKNEDDSNLSTEPLKMESSEISFVSTSSSDFDIPKNTITRPRKVPVHAPGQDLELQYHINRWLHIKYKDFKIIGNNIMYDNNSMQELSKFMYERVTHDEIVLSDTLMHALKSMSEPQSLVSVLKPVTVECRNSTLLRIAREEEERSITGEDLKNDFYYENDWLQKSITRHLLQLRQLYYHYATIACDEKPNFKPVLVRLMLWQMLRDAGIHRKGISLIDVDNSTALISYCMIHNKHDPFERLHFWQFLHILIHLSWMLYGRKFLGKENAHGCVASSFQKLLLEDIFPNCNNNNHIGSVLFDKRDLLPLTPLYMLYKKVGEPHTAQKFLLNICNPCKEDLQRQYNSSRYLHHYPDYITNGKNAVGVGGETIYLPENEPLMYCDLHTPIMEDPKICDLISMSNIGATKVVDCLTEICPGIKSEDGIIFNISYELTFLEFYEVLLLCAELSIRKDIIKQERLAALAKLKLSETGNTSSIVDEPEKHDVGLNTLGVHSSRKKKGRKSSRRNISDF